MSRPASGRVTAAQKRKQRLEAKVAAEEAQLADEKEKLAQVEGARETLTTAIQIRAGRVSALREELEEG